MKPLPALKDFSAVLRFGALFLFALAPTLVLRAQNYATPYTFTTLAGTPGASGSDDSAAATFYNPTGAAADALGNVYVADYSNNTIRKITPAGEVTTFAGSPGVSGSVDGTGSAARFSAPRGPAVDAAGNVYVADGGNHTIRKITPAGKVSTLAGSAGVSGSANGDGSAARFLFPRGVAVDVSGNVFVADSNQTIRAITPSGTVTTLAGSAGVSGSADGMGSAARFNDPAGVAVDSAGNVYVAEGQNATIRKITPAGGVSTLAGSAGLYGTADGTGAAARFYIPQGVAVDSTGNVYVADKWNATIRKITSAGVVTTLAGSPTSIGDNDGVGSAAQFNNPSGVAVDAVGTVYATDYYTVRKITSGGLVSTLGGKSLVLGSHDTAGAQFSYPYSVAVDGSHNVYVADFSNSTIRKITAAGVVTTLAGAPGAVGSVDATGSAARFRNPEGVSLDSAGNIYVADYANDTIRKITPAGVVSTLAGQAFVQGSADGAGSTARFYYPQSVAVDASGNVYVADTWNETIRKITPAGVVSTLAGAPGASGSADGTGSAARFYFPSGVAVDGAGNVYVADNLNHTIRKITPAGVVSTLAGSPGVIGSTDATGSAARFYEPAGIAVDGAGNVYVTDSGNYTIRKITPAGEVTTLAGSVATSGTADGTGRAALFYSPQGLAVDAVGTVYVADYGNQTIRMGVPAAINPVATVTLDNLNTTYTGSPQSATATTIPSGLAVTFTYDGSATPPTNAGSYTVVATVNDATYTGTATDTLVIAKANQIITFDPQSDKVVGDAPFPVSATVDSGLTPTFSIASGPATISGSTVTITGTGTISITASQAGDANHLPASASQQILVTAVGSTNYTPYTFTTFAGSPAIRGSADGTGSAASFASPFYVAVDASGNIYVSDTGNSTIRKITPAQVVTTLAGLPGTPGSANGAGSAARFQYPLGLAVDASGNVYVADCYDQTIRKISPSGVVSALAGLSSVQGSTDGTGDAAQFKYPYALAVDGSGNVYVADTYNSTIRKITPAGVVTTIAGLAGVDGSADGTGNAARFRFPEGLAVDASGNI